MASLQARHQQGCPLFQWTTFDKAMEGCECKRGPTYYAIHRNLNPPTTRLGANRKEAARSFAHIRAEVLSSRYKPIVPIGVKRYSTNWVAGLDQDLAPKTLTSYSNSATYAGDFFNEMAIHLVGTADLIAYDEYLRDEVELSGSTRHKHFSANQTMWKSAIARGHTTENPFLLLPSNEWPKKSRREAPYFLNDELPRIFAHMTECVYRDVCKAAHITGMRMGEILGLRTSNVHVDRGIVDVRHSYNRRTKNKRTREVALTSAGVQFFGGLLDRIEPGLCFPPLRPRSSGFLCDQAVARFLYAAMEAAGVPRKLEEIEESRVLHSFRHTYAKKVLEAGAPIMWLMKQLGHSSIQVTVDRYGHFERSEKNRIAAMLDGTFYIEEYREGR